MTRRTEKREVIGAINSALYLRLARRINEASQRVALSTEALASGQISLRGKPALQSFVTNLDSQMRGMAQARKNVEQAFGFVDLASSRLDKLSDIVTEIRDLSLKAVSTSLSSSERAALQKQAQDLLGDFDQLVKSTELGGKKLLNGSFNNIQLQVGPNVGNQFSISIGDARPQNLGGLALLTGGSRIFETADLDSLSTTLNINGFSIGALLGDSVSFAGGNLSGLSVANAINQVSSQTGVSARVLETEVNFSIDPELLSEEASEYGGSLEFNGSQFRINGVNIEGSFSSSEEFADLIDSYAAETGVRADYDGSNGIRLVADDGRNITVQIGQVIPGGSGGGGGDDDDEEEEEEDDIEVDEIEFSLEFFQIESGSLFENAPETRFIDVSVAAGVELSSSEAISLSGNTAQLLGNDKSFASVDSSFTLSTISLSDSESAARSVQILDATVAGISTLQAGLSAVHSRLSRTASSLIEGGEILEKTKSSLIGVDPAIEISSLLVAQLLQDSSIAALTQANISAASATKLLDSLIGLELVRRR